MICKRKNKKWKMKENKKHPYKKNRKLKGGINKDG